MKANVMPIGLGLILLLILTLVLTFGLSLEPRYWVMGSGLVLLLTLSVYVLHQIRRSMRQYVREPTL